MGSFVELNDTLQITSEQGFPTELNFEKHELSPLKAEDFANKIFEFHNKSGIRIYHNPPVRVFLVQNINGKWLYWGLVHMVEVTHHHDTNTTSGKFKIMYLYSPEEMKAVARLIDREPKTAFFA